MSSNASAASSPKTDISSTEQEIATVQAATAEDVDKAVNAAKAALKHDSWKKLPGTERGMLMYRLAELLEQNKQLLATIDAWDNGTVHILDLRSSI